MNLQYWQIGELRSSRPEMPHPDPTFATFPPKVAPLAASCPDYLIPLLNHVGRLSHCPYGVLVKGGMLRRT